MLQQQIFSLFCSAMPAALAVSVTVLTVIGCAASGGQSQGSSNEAEGSEGS